MNQKRYFFIVWALLMVNSFAQALLFAQEICDEKQSRVCNAEIQECLSCMYQKGFYFINLEESDEDVWWKQLPHVISDDEQRSYFLEASMINISGYSNKATLMAQPIWLSRKTTDNPLCAEGSDVFFYYLSSENPLQANMLYLWKTQRIVFMSKNVFQLPEEFSKKVDFKLLHIKYCSPRP